MEEEKNETKKTGNSKTRAKRKFRDANYDRVEFNVKKGKKEYLQEIIKQQGYTSVSKYVVDAIKEKYKKDTEKEIEI